MLDDASDEVGETIFFGFSFMIMSENGRLHDENILLPHSFRKENPPVCLLVKDKEKVKQSMIDVVINGEVQEIKGLEKIASLQKYKIKVREYLTGRDLKKKTKA